MPVSTDLDAAIARLSVAHAGGKPFGKTELGRLGRELCLIRDEAAAQERLLEEISAAGGQLAAEVIRLLEGARP